MVPYKEVRLERKLSQKRASETSDDLQFHSPEVNQNRLSQKIPGSITNSNQKLQLQDL